MSIPRVTHLASTHHHPRWLSLLALLVLPPMLSAQQPKELTRNEAVMLLRGGVSTVRVAALVTERGIDFEISPSTEAELRAAGANEELIATLRQASEKRMGRKAAPPATLVVKSIPGEAEVYLNDQPEATTSPEGKLVLSGLEPGDYRVRVNLRG